MVILTTLGKTKAVSVPLRPYSTNVVHVLETHYQEVTVCVCLNESSICTDNPIKLADCHASLPTYYSWQRSSNLVIATYMWYLCFLPQHWSNDGCWQTGVQGLLKVFLVCVCERLVMIIKQQLTSKRQAVIKTGQSRELARCEWCHSGGTNGPSHSWFIFHQAETGTKERCVCVWAKFIFEFLIFDFLKVKQY